MYFRSLFSSRLYLVNVTKRSIRRMATRVAPVRKNEPLMKFNVKIT